MSHKKQQTMKENDTTADKGFYSMEGLQDFCNLHNPGYRITERDVEKVNRLITWIRKDRTEAGEIHPATGDIVEYTTRSGEYYGRSHIEYIGDDSITVCLHPDIPFCHEDTDGIRYTTHGKSYSTLDRKSLEPAGTVPKEFKTWGHAGRNPRGTVHFQASVRMWRYIEPQPYFEGYTTQHWTSYLLEEYPDPERKGECTYESDRFTLYSKEELETLARTLHGKLFEGFYRGLLILWGYRMEWQELPAWEWNGLQAETRLSFLGASPVKIQTDHANHTVTIYKKSN